MMKIAATTLLMILAGTAAAQDSYHREGYFRKDGTYVSPARVTMPNDTKLDNYSTKGNYNPYTGKAGTVDPYKVEPYKPYQPYKSKY